MVTYLVWTTWDKPERFDTYDAACERADKFFKDNAILVAITEETLDMADMLGGIG